jgi:tetratricopeptide (TPR) repeat protein
MFNSNDWMAYYGKAYNYWYKDDINAIDNLYMAISLNHGPELPTLLSLFSSLLSNNGLIEKSYYYLQAALKLDGDSLTYLSSLATHNHFQGNQEKTIEFGGKAYPMDTTNVDILNILGHGYMFLDKNKESLKYFKQYVNRLNNLGDLTINTMHRIGYSYWVNGYKEKVCLTGQYTTSKTIHYSTASGRSRNFNRLSGMWKPNTRLSMKGSENGWKSKGCCRYDLNK